MTPRPVYFHGLPGGHTEIALTGLNPSNFRTEAEATPNSHLIAFSLGAHRALAYAAQNKTSRIDLIAPAAPLQAGNSCPTWRDAPCSKLPKTAS